MFRRHPRTSESVLWRHMMQPVCRMRACCSTVLRCINNGGMMKCVRALERSLSEPKYAHLCVKFRCLTPGYVQENDTGPELRQCCVHLLAGSLHGGELQQDK